MTTLYHTTLRANLLSIREQGIRLTRGVIYLHDIRNKDWARSQVARHNRCNDQDIVTLAVEVDELYLSTTMSFTVTGGTDVGLFIYNRQIMPIDIF